MPTETALMETAPARLSTPIQKHMPGARLAERQGRPLPETAYTIRDCEPRWSSRLNALIEAPWENDPPRLCPAMRAEVNTALAAIAAGDAPCTHDQIHRMMAHLSVIYPHARQSDDEARMQLTAYAGLLDQLPAYALRAAFRRAAQTIRFFPSVAELIELAHYPASLSRWREMRLLAMARKHDAEAQHDAGEAR